MDTWAEGDGYERYMGRWSEAVAAAFARWLDIGPDARWLDVGCGTGALSRTILSAHRPSHLGGVDASPEFIAAAGHRLGPGPDLRVADAASLPFDDDEFDVTVSGLCLNFIPDPAAALHEMQRVTRPDGTVAVYVWDYGEGMEMIRSFWDAAISLDPAAAPLDEAVRFPLCHPEPLAALFEESGLGAVDVSAVEVPTVFGSFDDFWSPFLAGQGPAPSYVSALDDARRRRLAEALERELPASQNGTIDLSARAWAARGVVV